MRIKVLFFAASREVAGTSETQLELQDMDGTQPNTASLLQALHAQYPGMEAIMKTCVLAVNMEYLAPDEILPLKEGDEVAVIPPLSGG